MVSSKEMTAQLAQIKNYLSVNERERERESSFISPFVPV